VNPLYHYFAVIPLMVNFVWALYRIVRGFRGDGVTGDAIVYLVFSFGVVALAAATRNQVLIVQDRLIRLEMRLRLREILPPEARAQVLSLTTPQLIALRFASDAEIPGLVADVLAGRCQTPKDIKMRVKDWQPDYQRA